MKEQVEMEKGKKGEADLVVLNANGEAKERGKGEEKTEVEAKMLGTNGDGK
jgi:hypothetical protein